MDENIFDFILRFQKMWQYFQSFVVFGRSAPSSDVINDLQVNKHLSLILFNLNFQCFSKSEKELTFLILTLKK